MIVDAWNVGILMDRDASSRPKRRTTLIAREPGRYQTDIPPPPPSSARPGSPKKALLRNQKKDTHSSGRERQQTKTEYMV